MPARRDTTTYDLFDRPDVAELGAERPGPEPARDPGPPRPALACHRCGWYCDADVCPICGTPRPPLPEPAAS